MTAVPPILERRTFDADAFGIPFFRVTDPNAAGLPEALATLPNDRPCIVDAKLAAQDIASAARLIRAGFRKVCVQIELHHQLDQDLCPPQRARIVDRVALSEADVHAHARNFTFDRFALDVALPAAGHDRIYEKWIRNSLEGPAHAVALSGSDFISFKEQVESVKIDLVSVLHKGQGNATDLLNAVLSHARDHGAKQVEVVTECENLPAVKLYLKAGFIPVRFFSVFHLVRLG